MQETTVNKTVSDENVAEEDEDENTVSTYTTFFSFFSFSMVSLHIYFC